MAKTISIGVIGCGARLKTIVPGLLARSPLLQITALADPDPAGLEDYAPFLAPGGTTFSTHAELLAEPPDWVLVGSYNAQHAAHAIAALDAGCHVFCEKPLATTLEDCLAIRDAIARTDRTFAFGLVLRYSTFYQKLKEVISSDEFGELVSFEFNETLPPWHGAYIHSNWRRQTQHAGSHLLEKCCHDLDLANWQTDSLPIKAASLGGRQVFTEANRERLFEASQPDRASSPYLAWQDRQSVINPFNDDKDIVDHQVAILEYANGVRGSFHTSCHATIPERRFYLLGTQGAVRGDLMAGQVEFATVTDTKRRSFDFGGIDGHGGADELLQQALSRYMLEGEAPKVGVREGICSAVSAFGIDQALETGNMVDLRPLWQQAGIDPLKTSA